VLIKSTSFVAALTLTSKMRPHRQAAVCMARFSRTASDVAAGARLFTLQTKDKGES